MKYRKSIVTFIDILGFKHLVETGDSEVISKVLATLQSASGPDDSTAEIFEMSFLTFSDCTVRAVPLDSKANQRFPGGLLFYELLNLVFCQYQLFAAGYLLRGGVTIGDIATDGNTVFGPALVQAYGIESEFSVYPRIVIDPGVWELLDREPKYLKKESHSLEDEKEYLKQLVRKDMDGLFFIDYLGSILSQLDYEGEEFQALGEHKDFIVKAASEVKGFTRLTSKFLWMAHYHNAVVNGLEPSLFEHYDKSKRDYVIDALVTKDARSLLHEF